MRNYSILIILLSTLLLSSCGKRSGERNANFHFKIDTSSITQYSTDGNRPTDPLFVSGKGSLTFFGVVIRKVGELSKAADGTPLGTIIPGASKMLTSFTHESQLVNLLTTGQTTMTVQVPVGTRLAVTTYLVYVQDSEVDLDGPSTMTTVFNVSSPLLIGSGSNDVFVDVDTNTHLDTAVPFVEWYGSFVDSAGLPVANKDIFLRHCKIGFVMSPAMFGDEANEFEKNLFRTDNNGTTSSFMILGPEFGVKVGSQVLKPCNGTPVVPNTNLESRAVFTGYKAGTLYTDPGAYASVLPAGTQTALFPGGTPTAITLDTATDHDGDGLSTLQELTESQTNPFRADFDFHPRFSHELSRFDGVREEGGGFRFYYRINSGTCDGVNPTFNSVAGSPALTTGAITHGTAPDDLLHCYTQIASFTAPANSLINGYIYEKTTGLADITLPSGQTAPVKHYFRMNVAGTGALTTTATSPTANFRYRNWETETNIAADKLNLKVLLGMNRSDNYMANITATGLEPGGIYYFTKLADNCDVTKEVMYADAYTSNQKPGAASIALFYDQNMEANLSLCNKLALNSTAGVRIDDVRFIPDTTKTYAEIKDQRVVAAPGVPYTPAHIYDTVNARHIICSNENLVPKIRVQVEGTTEVDITMTAPLDTASVEGKPFAFINSAGKPTCAFYDTIGKNQIYLATVEAGNTITHDSIALVDVSLAAGANYAYRNGAFFYLAQDSTGAIAGRVIDLATSSTNYTYTIPNTLTTQTNLQYVKPVITSAGEYVVVAYEGPSVVVKRYDGASFVTVDAFAPTTPVDIYAQAGNSGELYILTTHGPGAKVYKMPSAVATGDLIVDDATMPLSSGYVTGINKNRFVFTNGAEAKFIDESLGTIVNLMGYQNFYSIPQTNEAVSFLFDFIYYYFFDSATNTATIAKMITK